MNAFFFWENFPGLTRNDPINPYAWLLAEALEEEGIHLERGDYTFGSEWLESKRSEFEVIHLNWPQRFYLRDSLEDTLAALTLFAKNLALARSLGYRIVWTVHNLLPHERPFPDVDRLGRLLVCRLAHQLIAHCAHAAELAREQFLPAGDIRIIPHGHFIDVFENRIGRRQARSRLEIAEDSFVYLFFGNARVYKGIELLIEAFSRSAGSDATLLLMLRQPPGGHSHADEMASLAARQERVRVFESPFFDHDEFQIYLNASDAAVFSFTEVLTSGSVIAALSFGKPVIVPRLGCLPELVDESMGVLFDPKDERALDRALVSIRQLDLQGASVAARRRAESLDWATIARRTAAVYRGLPDTG